MFQLTAWFDAFQGTLTSGSLGFCEGWGTKTFDALPTSFTK